MKIGFKNFKKFKDFPMIELAPITFLVGPNNSGKSSFIKALTLLIYNLIQSRESIDEELQTVPFIQDISYFNNTTTNFGWGDYNSSLNYHCPQPYITFEFNIGDYVIQIDFGQYSSKDIKFFRMSPDNASIRKLTIAKKDENHFKIEYSRPVELLTPGEWGIRINGNPLIKEVIPSYKDELSCFVNSLKKQLYTQLIYIETHNANHKIAWNKNDKNDFVGQTILEFNAQSKLPFVTEGYKFITRWLKKFRIGERFVINKEFQGEIYSVDIIHDKEAYKIDKTIPGCFTPLGNMGTGAIQIFAMLLKLGIAIDKSDEGEKQLIIIEEPEQNSHPAFQSQLADIFHEAYLLSNKNINFVIETHSEYLIRRTQVMVAKEHYPDEETLEKKNPFKVYYFPEEGLPYDMKYILSGRFYNKFGEGFFDEASTSALTVSKLERKRYND